VIRRISFIVHEFGSLRYWIHGQTFKTPARVSTNPLPTPTRKTAATFRRKATLALLKRTVAPSLGNSYKGAKPSVKGRRIRLIAAQTGA